MEDQMSRSQRLESIGVLASGIAHDLNNILAPIMMGVEVLRTKTTDPRSLQLINTIESVTKRGSDIIKQVLTFARGSEQKKILLQPKHVLKELEKIVRETFPKDITLKTEIPKDLWNLNGDPTQIQQVVLNLCVNARDAMSGHGEMSITASNAVIDEQYASMQSNVAPGAYVKISVADTGVGIPEDLQERIFDPFFTTKDTGKGTGLGLSTVLSIVKAHEGFVHLESKEGQGSKFSIYLPADEGRNMLPPAAIPASEEPIQGKGELILLVDDEVSVLEIMRITLESSGYRVLTAATGTEGIALFAHHKNEIAAVITDIMMPEMDGIAMTRVMKHINKNVRLIWMSGHSGDLATQKYQELGVSEFIEKPFSAGRLNRSIRTLLDR